MNRFYGYYYSQRKTLLFASLYPPKDAEGNEYSVLMICECPSAKAAERLARELNFRIGGNALLERAKQLVAERERLIADAIAANKK